MDGDPVGLHPDIALNDADIAGEGCGLARILDFERIRLDLDRLAGLVAEAAKHAAFLRRGGLAEEQAREKKRERRRRMSGFRLAGF